MARSGDLLGMKGAKVGQIDDFLNNIRKSQPLGRINCPVTHELYLKLYIAYQQTWDSSKRRTASHFVIRFNIYRQREVAVVFVDGSVEAFSPTKARKAIDVGIARTRLTRLQGALRHAVRAQVEDLRTRTLMRIAQGEEIFCHLNPADRIFLNSSFDVDHSGDGLHFVNLVDAWTTARGYRGRDIELKSGADGRQNFLRDPQQLADWRHFHLINAKLKPALARNHVKKSKSSSLLEW